MSGKSQILQITIVNMMTFNINFTKLIRVQKHTQKLLFHKKTLKFSSADINTGFLIQKFKNLVKHVQK